MDTNLISSKYIQDLLSVDSAGFSKPVTCSETLTTTIMIKAKL